MEGQLQVVGSNLSMLRLPMAWQLSSLSQVMAASAWLWESNTSLQVKVTLFNTDCSSMSWRSAVLTMFQTTADKRATINIRPEKSLGSTLSMIWKWLQHYYHGVVVVVFLVVDGGWWLLLVVDVHPYYFIWCLSAAGCKVLVVICTSPCDSTLLPNLTPECVDAQDDLVFSYLKDCVLSLF